MTAHTYTERDKTLLRRAKIYALIEIGLIVTVVLITTVLNTTNVERVFLPFLLGSIAISLALPMLLMKNPRIVYYAVIFNILLGLGLVAIYDPIDGVLSGGSWPLYFIWAPIAMLVLRDIRIFSFIALLNIGLFALIPQLEINGVIPVELLIPVKSLQTIWSVMLAVMIVLLIFMAVIGLDEEKATRRSERAIRELDESHTVVQKNAQALSKANKELQTALDRQIQLQQEVEKLGTPLISISEQVMLLPLIGTLEADRMQRMLETVPTTIHTKHTRHLIIDFTGSILADAQIVQKIETFIRTIELLGTQVTVTGVSSGLALTLAQQTGIELLERSGRLTDVLHASLHPDN